MRITLTLWAALFLAGCSSESLQRAGYNTLQNIEQQRCGNDPGEHCAEPQRYDDYQRQRKQN